MHTERSGTLITFDVHGPPKRTAFLCLPGWCVGSGVFARLARELAAEHHVITLDWRGHGDSASVASDFGEAELVEDALAVIDESGVERVIPIAQAHAGWVALALRRRLGDRVPKIVATSWIVDAPPPPFLAALVALQDPEKWLAARDLLFAMWLENAPPDVVRVIRGDMGKYDAAMWARGARAIAAAYRREGSPLAALSRDASPPTLIHIYAQPSAPEVLAGQRAFAREHAWFSVQRLDGASHFPTLELPRACAALIGELDV